MNSISGKIIDVQNRRTFTGTIFVENGRISHVTEEDVKADHIILPGFIDAHIHIESSMLVPSEFSRMAVVHGTVATISDPHEIGNVLGLDGIRYMIQNGESVPLKIYFGASPCIPATSFETAGATISANDIRALFEKDGLIYLSEMMNYPGVLNHDEEIMKKISIAKELGKPIDGHAPGLRGEQAAAYCKAGISTDHECFTLEEALEKIQYGMKIIIREGSAAKNYNALHSLISQYPDKVMFCSDDKHPNDLVEGHINQIVSRSVKNGHAIMDILTAACVNPVKHYGLDVGLLQPGDPADFIVVGELEEFNVKATYINGIKVAFEGKSNIARQNISIVNNFNTPKKKPEDFLIKSSSSMMNVIQALPGELITKKIEYPSTQKNGYILSNTEKDILKLTVVNRYEDAPPALAFINGVGLVQGAIASSVAHDSHNIVACGVDDSSICLAVNALIEAKGGVALVQNNRVEILPLPVAGLMSDRDGWEVAKKYSEIKEKTHEIGSTLPDPFMTLSFMALLVIPSIKLSDKGLFDAEKFTFMPIGF